MPYIYNEQHWDNFVTAEHNHQNAIGKNPRSFAESVGDLPPELLEILPNYRLSRNDLFGMVENQEDNRVIFLSVMAWGSMKIPHCRLSLESLDQISDWIESIRFGDTSRREAYDSFIQIAARGIGPAYFTKLIFFLTARNEDTNTGYIMDQWTAKSVNLIINGINIRGIDYIGSLIKLTNQGYVDSKNESLRYEHFCRIVDQIGGCLEGNGGNNPENIPWNEFAEEKMFSKGGINPMHWRSYTRAQFIDRNIMNLPQALTLNQLELID